MSSNNGYASRSAVFDRHTRRMKDVTVAGLKLRIRSLTEGELMTLAGNYMNERGEVTDLAGYRRSLIGIAWIDENAERMVPPDELHKIDELDVSITTPLFTAAQAFATLTEEAVEETAKN